MSVSFNTNFGNYGNPYGNVNKRRLDPDKYAEQYASQNNLSLEEAKNSLRAKYGDPSNSTDISSLGNASSLNSYDSLFGNQQSSSEDESDDSIFQDLQQGFQGLTSTVSGWFNNFTQSQDSQDSQESSEQNYNQNQSVNPFAQSQSNQQLDPDTMAQNYANENNMSLDEAKNALKEKYGEPTKPEVNSNRTSDFNFFSYGINRSKSENRKNPEEQALIDKGIPEYIIEQGNEAIRKYAEENNITLTAPKSNS